MSCLFADSDSVLGPSGAPLSDHTLDHERPHRDQSPALGWAYLPATGLGYVAGDLRSLCWKGSLSRADIHDASFLGMDADGRSGNIDNINGNWWFKQFWLNRK